VITLTYFNPNDISIQIDSVKEELETYDGEHISKGLTILQIRARLRKIAN
jgi:hypothetical protein